MARGSAPALGLEPERRPGGSQDGAPSFQKPGWGPGALLNRTADPVKGYVHTCKYSIIGGEFSTYMPKSTVTFMCSECGGESLRWAGQCPHCQAWNTLQEFQVRKAPSGARASSSARGPAALAGGRRPGPLNEIEPGADPRRPPAWGELNRGLGG